MHQAARRRLAPLTDCTSPNTVWGVRLANCLNDATGNGCWPKEAGRPSSPSCNTVNEPETTSMT